MDRYTLLNQYVDEHRNLLFEWGKIDCVQFVRNWAHKATGKLLCPDLQPYTSALGAVKELKRLGFDTLEQSVDTYFTPRKLNFQQRGDIATCESKNSDEFPIAIGICVSEVSVFLDTKGLVFNPTEQCSRFWTID